MFNTVIERTPFTTTAAKRIFEGKIYGDSYGSDVSFESTLRALLHARIGNDCISFERGDFRCTDARTEFGLREANLGYMNDHSIKLVNCGATAEQFELWRAAIAKNLSAVYPHFHFVPVEKITQFFKRVFSVDCYIDVEQKSVLLVVNELSRRTYHYLQCAIPAFLPWYFTPERGLTDIERALIESLRAKTPDDYISVLQQIAESLNFREEEIRSILTNFENTADRESLRNAESEIERYQRKINEYSQMIADCVRRQYDLQTTCFGLQARMAEKEGKDSEILEYFLANKKLKPVSVSGSTLRFIAADTLEYIDETMAETYLDNNYSYFYTFGRGRGTHAVSDACIKAFLKALLLDKTIKMRMCACYDMDLRGYANAKDGYSYGWEYSCYIPNPHIQYFACMGNYGPAVTECLQRGDYITAIENCVSSAKNLNVGDGTVIKRFLSNLFDGPGVSSRCIEMPDGRFITPIEAARELGNQQEG